MTAPQGEPEPGDDLDEVLGAVQWLHVTRPFPHWVARNVLSEPVYQRVEEDFQARLNGSSAPAGTEQFARALPTSEATAVLFSPTFAGPLTLFLTRAWRGLIARVTGANLTEHVSGGLHHHRPGDPNGFIHNDFNAGWFVPRPRDDGTVVADHTACRYGTGEPRQPGVQPQPLMRAVSTLFYLANSSWTPGDGGGTGLFAHRDDPIDSPAVVVPPLNNSLLVFRCTPYSHHCFIGNGPSPRNSVAMWFHRTPSDAVNQWGERAVRRVRGAPLG